MSVELIGIEFDHAAGAALQIRHDRATAAPANVAAYPLVPTKGQPLTIKVTLRFPVLSGSGLAVGAHVLVRAHATSTSSKVLGNVGELDVVVPASRQAAFVFQLQAPKLHAEGIGIYTVKWDWQFQLTPTSPWLPFHASTKTIYITLDVPGPPWTQVAASPNLPWIRMLNLACAWANGVKLTTKSSKPAAVKKVAKKVEKGVYGLGASGKFVYSSGGGGNYCFGTSAGEFKVTKFIDDIEGPGEGFPIYCTECAAAVATAVNCLGGDLSLLRIDRPLGAGPIHLNSYILIGKDSANEGDFDFHDVAVRPNGTSTQVFDATLMPDWEVNVANTQHDHKLTQGRRLGKKEVKPKGTAYLQRLLEGDVAVQWTDLKMCPVTVPCLDSCNGPTPADPCTDQQFQNVRAAIGQAVPIQPLPYPQPPLILPPQIAGFSVVGRIDNPPRLAALAPFVSASAEFLYVASSKVKPRGSKKVDSRQFKIAMSWSPTQAQALDALAWLMVRTPAHLSDFPPKKKAKIGDLARGSTRSGVVYLVRRNVVAQVFRVGESIPPTEMIANRVDQDILANRAAPPGGRQPPGSPPPMKPHSRISRTRKLVAD